MLHSPPQMKNDSIITDVTCNGESNASIQVNISGGVPDYTYLWYSSDVTIPDPDAKDQVGLAPGKYELKITDKNECEKNETYVLIEPDPLIPNLVPEDMSCFPGNDGYIKSTPSGGTLSNETPDYLFLWHHDQSTTSEVTGLSEGTYTVTVTDANGCSSKDSADIKIPSALTATAKAGTNYNGYHIDCYGNNTGKIILEVKGSRRELNYEWSSGDVTADIDHAQAGFYSVTVTDYFNCQGNASITLTQPNQLWGQFAVTDVSCYGDHNGSIHALIGGGVTPYHFQWSNGAADTSRIDYLAAATYRLQVVDQNDCILDDLQATVAQPSAININFTITDAFCSQTSDGEIWAVVSGGTSPYTYQWTDRNGAISQSAYHWIGTNHVPSPSLAGLSPGVYSLEVTDAINCMYSQSAELGYKNEQCLRIPNAFSPNDDGENDQWEITVGDAGSFDRQPLGEMYPDASVEVWSAIWGMRLYQSKRGYPEPWDGKYRGKYLPADSYMYIIRLNNQIKPITGTVTIIR
jgi:gliding motility-associated-like protein